MSHSHSLYVDEITKKCKAPQNHNIQQVEENGVPSDVKLSPRFDMCSCDLVVQEFLHCTQLNNRRPQLGRTEKQARRRTINRTQGDSCS